jgi:hypothetical protein
VQERILFTLVGRASAVTDEVPRRDGEPGSLQEPIDQPDRLAIFVQ